MNRRIELFIAWYKQLRERRHEFPFPFYHHTSYNIWNCLRWALYNSANNDMDGNYLYRYSECGKYKKRIRK